MSYMSYLHMDCELYKPREDGGYNLLPIPNEMVDELEKAIWEEGDFEVIDVRNGNEGSVNYDYYVERLIALSKKFPNVLFRLNELAKITMIWEKNTILAEAFNLVWLVSNLKNLILTKLPERSCLDTSQI